MKWFYDLKIGIKLLSSFIIVALIAGGIGLIGVVNINKINTLDTQMYEEMTAPLGTLITTTQSYQNIRSGVRDIILSNDRSGIEQTQDLINKESEDFDKSLDEFSKTIITEQGQVLVKDLKTSKIKYMENVNQMINLVKSGKQQEALEILHGQGNTVAGQVDDSITQITQAKLTLAKNASNGNTYYCFTSSGNDYCNWLRHIHIGINK
jgi:methyl-accepting chemotaxis protein